MTRRSPARRESANSDRILQELEFEVREDRRRLKWALLAALLVHAALLAITFPGLTAKPSDSRRQSRVFQVQHVRFKPPPPPKPQGRQQIQKPKKKRIPIPDPTPDEPEPLLVPEVTLPEIDLPEIDDGVFFAIPDAPPGTGSASGDKTALRLGGDVRPPVGIYTPQPRYTEEARRARIQGTVLLRAVIDETGHVTGLETLKGLSLGLTDSALEAVRGWKYEPATLDGEPVPVYLHLMVRFSLQ